MIDAEDLAQCWCVEGSPSVCSPPSAAGEACEGMLHQGPAAASRLGASCGVCRNGPREEAAACQHTHRLPLLIPGLSSPTPLLTRRAAPSHRSPSGPVATREPPRQPPPRAALAGVWSDPRMLTAPLHLSYDTQQIADSGSRIDGWTCRPGDRTSSCWGFGVFGVFFFHIK